MGETACQLLIEQIKGDRTLKQVIIPTPVSYTHLDVYKRQYINSAFLQQVFGAKGGSLIFALLFVLLNWAIGYILYKKKIYIKICLLYTSHGYICLTKSAATLINKHKADKNNIIQISTFPRINNDGGYLCLLYTSRCV